MLTELLSILIGLFFLLLIISIFVKNIKFYKQTCRFTGPKAYPIIGNAYMFVGKTVPERWDEIIRIYDSYSSPSRLWMGHQFWINVCKPDQVKIVLTSPKTLNKSDHYKMLESFIGTGLFTASASIWRVRRKLIQPSFNPKVLRTFINVFEKHSKIFVEELAREVNGDEFSIGSYLTTFALNVACESTMGISGISTVDGQSEFAQKVHKGFQVLFKRISSIWLYPDIIYKWTQLSKDYEECMKYVRRTTDDIIQKKKMERLMKNKNETDKTENKMKPFLELMLELAEETKFTDQDISDETNTMIIAASDTIKSSLRFIILILASHPDVQDKIYKELRNIFGDINPENLSITCEELQKMEYMERVIKESLRIFPPARVIMRKVIEDLDVENYTYPKGSQVFIPIIKIHRDEEYWPDPFRFDPDRFLPEEIAKRHPYSYLPFSAGPRNCIGIVYAMMETKVLLARLILRYVIKKKNVKPLNEIKVHSNVAPFSVETITVKIENRING